MESARRRSAFSPGQIALVYLPVRLRTRVAAAAAAEGECIVRPEGTRRPKTDCVVYRIECRCTLPATRSCAISRGKKYSTRGSKIGVIFARASLHEDFAVQQFFSPLSIRTFLASPSSTIADANIRKQLLDLSPRSTLNPSQIYLQTKFVS